MKNNMQKDHIKMAENIVCKLYNIPPEFLYIKNRTSDLTEARFIVWRFMSEELDMSSVRIAVMYGKDHSTVLYGINRAKTQPLIVNYVRFITRFKECVQPVDNGGYSLGTYCGKSTEAVL